MNTNNTNETPLQNGVSEAQSVHCSALLGDRAVITHGGSNRCYQKCKCGDCGVIEECTPHRDFYTTTDDNGPLMCESCFRRYVIASTKSPNEPRSARLLDSTDTNTYGT